MLANFMSVFTLFDSVLFPGFSSDHGGQMVGMLVIVIVLIVVVIVIHSRGVTLILI